MPYASYGGRFFVFLVRAWNKQGTATAVTFVRTCMYACMCMTHLHNSRDVWHEVACIVASSALGWCAWQCMYLPRLITIRRCFKRENKPSTEWWILTIFSSEIRLGSSWTWTAYNFLHHEWMLLPKSHSNAVMLTPMSSGRWWQSQLLFYYGPRAGCP